MGGCGSKDKTEVNSYLLQVISEHTGGINCIALSEDGSMLASGSEDKTCRLWTTQTETCECIGVLVGHEDYVNCVCVEETFVVTGSADKTIRKWDLTTCDCIFIFRGHNSLINRLICTGDLLFSSSYDRTARAWDFESGEEVRLFTGHKRGVYPMIFIAGEQGAVGTAGKDLLVTGSADLTARVWSFDTGKSLRTLSGHSGAVTCMSTDAQGKILFTGSTDYTVRSWRISTGEHLKLFEGHTGAIICLHYSNRVLYTGSSDHSARSWVAEYGTHTRTFKGHHHTVSSLKVIKGLLYTTCGDGVCRCYDAKSGALRRSFKGHLANINAFQIVQNRLFTASHDCSVRVWDLEGILTDTTAMSNGHHSKNVVSHHVTGSRIRVAPISNGNGATGHPGSPADNTQIKIDNMDNGYHNNILNNQNKSSKTNGNAQHPIINGFNE